MAHARIRRPAVVLAVALIGFGSLPAYAATWSPAATVSAPNGVSSQQQVAIDAKGAATVVWAEEVADGRRAIKSSQRPSGGTWSSPRTLSDATRDASEPQVAASSDGLAVAAWTIAEAGGRRVMAAQRTASGSWSTPAAVSAMGGVSRPRLAGNVSGDAVLMWHQRNGLRAVRLTDGKWQSPQPVSAGGLQHEVALDNAGTAYAAWRLADSDRIYRIQASRGSSNGHWGTAKTLSRPGRNGEHPAVAVDGQGGATVIWVLRSSRRVVQAAQRESGGAWSSSTSLSDLARNAVNPDVAADANGTAVAVWQVNLTASDVSISTARRPSGGSWGAAEVLADAGASPQIGSDGTGTATVVWLVNSDGVQYARRPATKSWSPPATVAAEGAVWSVGLAVNDAGQAAAAWRLSDATSGASHSRVRASVLD